MMDVDAEEIRELPDEKLVEMARCTTGEMKNCPECGTKTAFLGAAGHNGKSSCHECEYTEWT